MTTLHAYTGTSGALVVVLDSRTAAVLGGAICEARPCGSAERRLTDGRVLRVHVVGDAVDAPPASHDPVSDR